MRLDALLIGCALLAGCSSVPELTPIARPDISVVAVAGARFEPVAKVGKLGGDPLAGAAKGAVEGGVTEASLAGLSGLALTAATANPYGAAITLLAVAVGAVSGTVHGALSGASAAQQGRRMDEATSAAANREQLLKLQGAFAHEVATALARKTGRAVALASLGPQSADEMTDYRGLGAQADSAVLEVALLDLEVLRQPDRKLMPTFTEIFTPVITVRGRLVRASDNGLLAELRYRHFMPPARAERWFARDAALFAERLR